MLTTLERVVSSRLTLQEEFPELANIPAELAIQWGRPIRKVGNKEVTAIGHLSKLVTRLSHCFKNSFLSTTGLASSDYLLLIAAF